MNRSSKPEPQETFEQMFHDMEESGDLYVEWAKNNIAEQIFTAMRREDVKKAELARRLGKSRAYITQILQGNVNFTVESLVRIAIALDSRFEVKISPKCVLHHWEYPHESSHAGAETTYESDEAMSSPEVAGALAA